MRRSPKHIRPRWLRQADGAQYLFSEDEEKLRAGFSGNFEADECIPRFLLNYATRDSVGVLRRGTGGVVEARIAIAQYPDKSPLYGFLLYRRRKVLIKYIPQGTSRLLQGAPRWPGR